jgi:hypothetical protein
MDLVTELAAGGVAGFGVVMVTADHRDGLERDA